MLHAWLGVMGQTRPASLTTPLSCVSQQHCQCIHACQSPRLLRGVHHVDVCLTRVEHMCDNCCFDALRGRDAWLLSWVRVVPQLSNVQQTSCQHAGVAFIHTLLCVVQPPIQMYCYSPPALARTHTVTRFSMKRRFFKQSRDGMMQTTFT